MRLVNAILAWLMTWGLNSLVGFDNGFQSALIFVLAFIAFSLAGIFDILKDKESANK